MLAKESVGNMCCVDVTVCHMYYFVYVAMPHPLDNSNTDESKRRMTTQPALPLPVEVKTVRRDIVYNSNILYSSDILTKPVILTLYPQ